MTTPAKIAANRRNAKRSTGPRTAHGKAVTSKNSLRHGLLAKDVVLASENPQAYSDLRDRVRAHFQPVGELEEGLVERVAVCQWRLRRAVRAEASLFQYQALDHAAERAQRRAADLERSVNPNDEALEALNVLPYTQITDEKEHETALLQAADAEAARDREVLAVAFVNDAESADALSKLSRYEASIERGMFRAMHELQRLQAARAGEPVTPPVVVDVEVSTPSA